jgi:four helix bundle protein
MTKNFTELKVWQKAHELVLSVYKITKSFPDDERFGLISQIRRSSVSVAANIVEGHKRKSDKDFAHFLNIAEGSLEETKYYTLLSRDLKYTDNIEYADLSEISDETGKMLKGLYKKLIA